jgi:peptidase M15B and M15C DD-carboxypeptidase vanY/endolysin
MAKKKISREKSIQRSKSLAELIICIAMLGAGAYLVKSAVDRSSVVEQSPYYDNAEITEPSTDNVPDETDPDKVIYESSVVSTKDKYKGNLILVNEDHQYFGGDEDLVSILEMNDQTGRDFFTSVDYTYTILGNVYEPMAIMIKDFYDIYQNDTLTIYGAYRSAEFQQQLYDQDLAETGEDESTRVAKPGFSEHETGYAFDFSEVVNYDYDGTGDFAWINENCYKYGFVERYAEDKEDITKIQYEPWHFRFVGIPHAYYMTKNDLCLEEYIELLKKYPYEGNHLEITDDEGRNFEVYYVPSDDGSETTTVPVPAGMETDISGNNIDGFIVTVYKDGKPELMKYEKPADEPDNSGEEDSSAEDDNNSQDSNGNGENI